METKELIEKIKHNIDWHMKPYNLGDMGETETLILDALSRLEKLEAQTDKGGQAEVRVIPKIAWANEKPKTVGLYFRSNPVLQREISEQIVFKLDGELWTYHPHNETSKKTKIKDMPNSFWWIQIPIPEHWKVKLDYDKR